MKISIPDRQVKKQEMERCFRERDEAFAKAMEIHHQVLATGTFKGDGRLPYPGDIGNIDCWREVETDNLYFDEEGVLQILDRERE